MKKSPVDFGMFLQQEMMPWNEYASRVIHADRAGFHSAWMMDHLYPPGSPAGPSYEAWIAATALATQTERIRLGHMVLCNSFRHPALLAKMVTTLDVISKGRVNVGIGSGSVEQEHKVFGIPFPKVSERTSLLEESVRLLKLFFTQESITFAGKHFTIQGASAEPKPLQKPHPPIYVGGGGERFTLPLVARHADAWNCNPAFIAAMEQKIAVLKSECAKAGRDFSSLKLTMLAPVVIVAKRRDLQPALDEAKKKFGGPGWGMEAARFYGTPDDVIKAIKRFQDKGVTGFMLRFTDGGDPRSLSLFAKEVIPAFT